jgi:acetone carboxylase gamma subunit
MAEQRVAITEYLEIDLVNERWHCRRCGHDINDARSPYKEGLLVYERDPREIHDSIIDDQRYEFTYAPDPKWCRIVEFYCPGCGTMIENEYLPPGLPLTHDLDLDIDSLKERHRAAKGTANASS